MNPKGGGETNVLWMERDMLEVVFREVICSKSGRGGGAETLESAVMRVGGHERPEGCPEGGGRAEHLLLMSLCQCFISCLCCPGGGEGRD